MAHLLFDFVNAPSRLCADPEAGVTRGSDDSLFAEAVCRIFENDAHLLN